METKTHADQVYYKLFLLSERNDHKPSKVAAAKTVFSGVYVLFHLITGRHYLIIKVYRYSEYIFNHHVVALLKEVLKEVRVLWYLRNSSARLILKFQNKSAICYTCSIFLTNFMFLSYTLLKLDFLFMVLAVNGKRKTESDKESLHLTISTYF